VPRISASLIPCLYLLLAPDTVRRIEGYFSRCPLCDGSGTCNRADAEAEDWYALNPTEDPESGAE